MLKRLSLIYLRFIPLLFILDEIIKYFCGASIIPTSTYTKLIPSLDIIKEMILVLGFILFFFTFRFCIYHRLILYFVLMMQIAMLIYWLFFSSHIDECMFFHFLAIFIMVLLVLIIYIYLKKRYNKSK